MKSIRLKRSNHKKSRKHKTRKIKKGGNGRSSQEILTNLLNLLDDYQSYLGDIDDLSREEPMDNIKIRQIQVDLNDLENSIVSIFRNNSLELSTLSVRQKEALLYAVLRTSGEIAEAYAHAYSNLETKEQMPIEIIDELINEFEIEIENIEIAISEILLKARNCLSLNCTLTVNIANNINNDVAAFTSLCSVRGAGCCN
jgi:hypothetical protein